MRRPDPVSKSDRVLLVAMAVILATASALLGTAMTSRVTERVLTASAPAEIEDSVAAKLISEHRCLSEALYYEARGEGLKGQQAVAEVVLRRMNRGNDARSICSVVYEGAGRQGCQFSFTCSGILTKPRDAAAWTRSEQLAAQILTGEVRLHNMTGDATYYHAVSVRPYWAPRLEKTARIGNHIFYREGLGRARGG
jgi:spore germination cell wall hydrolase CwlJ-like protein